MALNSKEHSMSDEAVDRHIEQALAVTEEAHPIQQLLMVAIKRYFNTSYVGEENIPNCPVLFVGMHSAFAADSYIVGPVMRTDLKRFIRPMGEKVFFELGVEKLVLSMGGVIGHPRVCTAMMEAGQDLLVYPGGARESTKRIDERYQLMWGERYGFIRLAAAHGYTIVPFASTGTEEIYDRYMESHEVLNSAFGKTLIRLGLIPEDIRPDVILPIPKGVMGTFMPKPQEVEVGFGKALDLSAYKGKTLTLNKQKELRAEVEESMKALIDQLRTRRKDTQPYQSTWRKILNR